jgi:uncharacterized protein YbjT (DUF2867 family)
MIPSTSPITVLGATGKTGRRVVSRLRSRGVPVRVGSRSASPPFDWARPSTWPAVFEGASAAYVSYYPDLAAPGAPEAVGELFDVAVAAGASRIVLLSGRGESEAQRSEEVLAASGASWTVVRASWFNQNFSEGAFAEMLATGELALPADDVREPFVDAGDIADVAVAALTEPGHENRVYEVAGPRLLTFAQAVAEIATATGRPLRYTPISLDDFMGGLSAAGGVPAPEAALLRYLFSEVLDGRNAFTTGGVEQALGREPRDFTTFAHEAAASSAWSSRTHTTA